MTSAFNWSQLLPTLATIVIAACGWAIVHQQNLRREVTAEKRKIRIGFLLEAYRKLERACHYDGDDETEYKLWLETALADIQLLGTLKQDQLAKGFAKEFAQNGTAQLDELLDELRRSLRSELELEPIADKMLHLRMKFEKNAGKRTKLR